MKPCIVWLLTLLAASGLAADTIVIKKALRIAAAGEQRVQNGSLDTVVAGTFAGWHKWALGHEIDARIKHSGRFSARCHNPSPDEQRGLTQVVTLNQAVAGPITAECWSRCENVAGSPDANYSLYLDLEYTDGTPLWGQVATFKPGARG